MLFAKSIIREAGLSVQDFPKAAQIPVKLYDRKDRLVEDSEIHFVEPLFANNLDSKLAFERLLRALEAFPLSELVIRIDEDIVAVNYKTVSCMRFSRRPALDPMDYMD